jgi:cobalt-zinc-cadmium efflux system membrane fusion protein
MALLFEQHCPCFGRSCGPVPATTTAMRHRRPAVPSLPRFVAQSDSFELVGVHRRQDHHFLPGPEPPAMRRSPRPNWSSTSPAPSCRQSAQPDGSFRVELPAGAQARRHTYHRNGEWAGPGHDHGHDARAGCAAATARSASPMAAVFLPKPAQRQWQAAHPARGSTPHCRAPTSCRALVVMDPNAGGKVQATQAGRLQAAPGRPAQPGPGVRKGEVLAYVVPTAGRHRALGNQAAAGRTARRPQLAEKRLARLQELADTVPRRDIEAAQSELHSLARAPRRRWARVWGRARRCGAPVVGRDRFGHAVAGQVWTRASWSSRWWTHSACASRRWPTTQRRPQTSAGATLAVGGNACRCAFWARRQPARAGPAAGVCGRGPAGAVGTGAGPAGAGVAQSKRASKGVPCPRQRCCARTRQPDHRLGQAGARALRAARGHHSRWTAPAVAVTSGPAGGRARGHAGRHAAQPGPLKEPPCSSGYWKAAWPTGCWC